MSEKTDIRLFSSTVMDNFSSVLLDFGEVGLDTGLEESILRELPVLSTLVALYKGGVGIRNWLFVRKLITFLKELSSIPLEERQNFLEEIERNPQKSREFEGVLLLLIERADSFQKPSILGKLLKHHILGNISYEDATRLSYMVDRVYIYDLYYLLNFTYGVQRNPNIAASLESIGLLSFAGIDGGKLSEPTSGGVIYGLNEYGKMLLKYGLDTVA